MITQPTNNQHQASEIRKTCPACRQSDQVIPIIYGYPGKALMIKADLGIVKLGGCCYEKGQPQWHCKRDSKAF